jgi:hypothetical protein
MAVDVALQLTRDREGEHASVSGNDPQQAENP